MSPQSSNVGNLGSVEWVLVHGEQTKVLGKVIVGDDIAHVLGTRSAESLPMSSLLFLSSALNGYLLRCQALLGIARPIFDNRFGH
jgi:hypothetical protein